MFFGLLFNTDFKTHFKFFSYCFYLFNLYNFIFQRLIGKITIVSFLCFHNWTLKESKTVKVQNHCLSILTILHKWLSHLNFDMFTAVMFIFFLRDSYQFSKLFHQRGFIFSLGSLLHIISFLFSHFSLF